jgi:hypothetical protein
MTLTMGTVGDQTIFSGASLNLGTSMYSDTQPNAGHTVNDICFITAVFHVTEDDPNADGADPAWITDGDASEALFWNIIDELLVPDTDYTDLVSCAMYLYADTTAFDADSGSADGTYNRWIRVSYTLPQQEVSYTSTFKVTILPRS